MSIAVQCSCGCRLKAPDQFAGTRAECPACGRTVDVPVPLSPPHPGEVPEAGSSPRTPSSQSSSSTVADPIAIEDFLDPPTKGASRKRPAKTVSLRVMFDTLLDPRSIEYMLMLGGGLLVLGVVIWLVSLGIFKDPTTLAVAMGAGSLAVLSGGWWLSLKTRYRIAGQALTFLGCVILPLNLWFYHAQNLITLEHHLWIGGLVCCLIYAATVYILRDHLFMYAVEFGVTLTALLLLAELKWIDDTSFLCAFLSALGLFSIHAEHAFSPDADETFNRRRFGLPLFWSGHAQLGCGLVILLGTQICGWLFEPARSFLGIVWTGNSLSQSPLMAGGLWLVGTYAYLYSDLVVRRIGVYTYLAAFCMLMAEITIIGDQLQTEGIIAVLALTALTVNLLRNQVQHTADKLARSLPPLALAMSFLPVVMGVALHLRATSPLAGTLFNPAVTGWSFVAAMIFVAACNRISAYLFRNLDPKNSAIYFFLSAGSLVVAAAGLLRQCELTVWTQQAPLLMLIPLGYLIASRLWKGRSPERPLVWIAHTATGLILIHGILATLGSLGEILRPIPGNLDNLLLGIVFSEATLFYTLAGIFRKRSANIYLAAATACAGLWQFVGYWGQIDPAYYTMLYGALGIAILALGRMLGLETLDVYAANGQKGQAIRGRGLPLFQSGNAILIIAFLAAMMQGLGQLASQQVTSLTLTALVLTTITSCIAIPIVPAGNWRRLYWTTSMSLAALCALTINVLVHLNTWQKLEILCVVIGTILVTSSYIRRFLESDSHVDDSVTTGLWFGSLLITAPLLIALCYYRFNEGQLHWQEELVIVLSTILMLVTGFAWRVKSTTLIGGGTLFLYLFVVIGQLAYRPQIATGVYLAIGGGLVFLTGLSLSIYREKLLQLPDRIAKREGVFQIISWR